MDLLFLAVTVRVDAAGMLFEELRPGVLGLALEEDVAVRPAPPGYEGRRRPADDDQLAAGAETVRDGEDMGELEEVAGDADDVGVAVVIDRLPGVLVADGHLAIGRRGCGEGEQPERRIDGPIGRHLEEVLLAPVGGRDLRLDKTDPTRRHPW